MQLFSFCSFLTEHFSLYAFLSFLNGRDQQDSSGQSNQQKSYRTFDYREYFLRTVNRQMVNIFHWDKRTHIKVLDTFGSNQTQIHVSHFTRVLGTLGNKQDFEIHKFSENSGFEEPIFSGEESFHLKATGNFLDICFLGKVTH